jgi:uncharacterized Zn-finger protein
VPQTQTPTMNTDADSVTGSEHSYHAATSSCPASPLDFQPSPPPSLDASGKPSGRRRHADDGCCPVYVDSQLTFPCNKCGKTFGTRSHWSRHQRVHSDERPYACKFCHKMFRQAPHRDSHHRIHTNEKPSPCPPPPPYFTRVLVLVSGVWFFFFLGFFSLLPVECAPFFFFCR